jgi:hypothetical protein
MGHRLDSIYPVVPLAANQSLGVAVVSYAGKLGFGLLGDYDAMPHLDALSRALEDEIALMVASSGPLRARSTRRRPASRGPLAPPEPVDAGD